MSLVSRSATSTTATYLGMTVIGEDGMGNGGEEPR